MISYSQQSDRAAMLSRELRSSLRETGLSIWFDVDMNDESEAAMKEAVEHARVVTGDGPRDEFAYAP